MGVNTSVRVVCDNCGGTDWTAVSIGAVGLIVAVIALYYAARASKLAKHTLDLATQEHALTRAQHDLEREQFEQQQADRAARARFKLTVDLVHAVDGVVVTESPNLNIRLRIGIRNVGERAAGTTTVNLLVPQSVRRVSWTGPNGEPAGHMPPDAADETIGDGEPVPAMYLTRQLDSIALRSPVVMYATIHLEGLAAGAERRLPVRLKAQADELPEDIDEVSVDRLFVVKRAALDG